MLPSSVAVFHLHNLLCKYLSLICPQAGKEIVNGEFDEAFWKQVTTRKIPEAEAKKIVSNFAILDDEADPDDQELRLCSLITPPPTPTPY
jgi:hypothetical protein